MATRWTSPSAVGQTATSRVSQSFAEAQGATACNNFTRGTRPAIHSMPLLVINLSKHNDDMTTASFLRVQSDGLLLAVKLQPRASANEIGGPLGNELRVKVTASPVDSAANEALLRLLAERLDCPRGQMELVRGRTSRHKVIKLYGISAEAALARLIPTKSN